MCLISLDGNLISWRLCHMPSSYVGLAEPRTEVILHIFPFCQVKSFWRSSMHVGQALPTKDLQAKKNGVGHKSLALNDLGLNSVCLSAYECFISAT